jgi:hypothetical protein
MEPAQGSRFKEAQQPIRLVVQNALSTGVRPLSYMFEVATDSAFTTKVFARGAVPPGDGSTTIHIDKLQVGRTYHWRARAEDGANTGPFLTAQFEILPAPFISTPVPLSPIGNERTSTRRPSLRVRNVDRNAAVGGLVYEFQVSSNQAFSQLSAAALVDESPGETAFTVYLDLPPDQTQYWRARAFDAETMGDWMAVQVFRTPNAPSSPGPGPGPAPGGGGAPPGNCASSNGAAIVNCIAAKYPERLVGGISLPQRQENMAFLRDRIIEAAKCGGMDAGWNLKRGGPELSIDFLAVRRSDGEMGIDIGFDYDNTSTTLRLQWAEAGLGATYLAYPSVPCN